MRVVVAVGGGARGAGRDLGRDTLVEGNEGGGGGILEGGDDGGAREEVRVDEGRPGRDAVVARGVLFLDGAWVLGENVISFLLSLECSSALFEG